jgi:hypothetical protein
VFNQDDLECDSLGLWARQAADLHNARDVVFEGLPLWWQGRRRRIEKVIEPHRSRARGRIVGALGRRTVEKIIKPQRS